MITVDPAPFIQLRDHLNAELACVRALLPVMEEKQRQVVAGQITAFAATVEREERLALEQGRLRQVRERLLIKLALGLGKAGDLRLSTLIAMAPEPLRGELSSRQLLLKDGLMRLRELNERNQALVRQGLGLVRDLVGALVGSTPDASYDRRGVGGSGLSGNGRLLDIAG